MSRSPKVSVLLPVRNGLPWLQSALDSVFAQTFTDFELIVLEDGSTDDTPLLLDVIDDPRMRVLATGGVGIARALNAGLLMARGEYVARQDADDESLPQRFAKQVALLDRDHRIAVVATAATYIDAMGATVDNDWVRTVRTQQDVALEPGEIASLLPLTCCITHGSVMARASVFRAAGGYRTHMVPAEDYDLWLRLVASHDLAKLPERLYRHRLHGGQSGALRRDEQINRTLLAKLLHVRRLYPALPRQARLGIAGESRGDRYYAAVGPSAGFEPVAPSAQWDVLAVTDFSQIAAVARAIGPGATRVGNLLVRDA